MELYRSAIGEKAAKARGAKKLQEGEVGIFVTDYLVYKVGGELILHTHCQDAEEDLLLHEMVPGEDVVVVTDPAREGSETLEAAATREARMYFRGEHQEPKRIDCWVAGALERQKCLKASAPSNSS